MNTDQIYTILPQVQAAIDKNNRLNFQLQYETQPDRAASCQKELAQAKKRIIALESDNAELFRMLKGITSIVIKTVKSSSCICSHSEMQAAVALVTKLEGKAE